MTDIPDEAVDVAQHAFDAPLDADTRERFAAALTAALPILERAWIERLTGEENDPCPCCRRAR